MTYVNTKYLDNCCNVELQGVISVGICTFYLVKETNNEMLIYCELEMHNALITHKANQLECTRVSAQHKMLCQNALSNPN